MNIVVTGTKVTLDTCILAFQKNNLVDTISITVDTDDTWQYKLDVKLPKTNDENGGLYNVIDLVREGNTCTVVLQSSMLPFRGRYVMQLRGISGDKVYHTDTFFVLVEYSIDPGAVYNPIPSEFYQIEQEVTNQAANAKQYEIDAKAAKEAAQSSQERAELAAKESKKFAEQSESASEHSPKIGQNGNWLLWDPSKNIFVDTGTPATGPKGKDGAGMDVTGATVGQIAKITAVDGTGKPTAWEAVDMPSGGGETWELINEITIPDDAEETNALVINKDLNGNPFELKKALLFVYMPKYTGGSTIPTYAFSSLNGINGGASAPAVYTSFVSPNGTHGRSMWWRVSVANNGLPYHEELAKTNVSGNKRDMGGNGSIALFDEYIIDGTEPAKESITEIGTKGNLIYAGCYFALYGVRK